ncbi:MAG: DUF502 domain-containing protein [Paracoccaceae bacterium]|jgi:uncharacterized membrane protein
MTAEPQHPPAAQSHARRTLLGAFRANFLTGLVVVLPVGLTIWLIWNIVGWIDSWVLPFVPYAFHPNVMLDRYLGYQPPVSIRGFGVIIFLVFTIFVGWIAKGLIGRQMIAWGESLVDRMPFVRSIYNGLKQIAETVFSQSESKFDTACLIEYPRPGIWAVGFVSTAAKGEVASKIPVAGEVLTVFLPTTPNPTSGFLLYVPRKDVILLEKMGVEDAAKLIISAGLVYPAEKSAIAAR